ncbi:MAG: aminotransferase class I/II-fold pyridoxal phosphate-dependent enzyme, partial [Opitutales bacterium]
MATALARPHLLSLAAGFTDNAVVPADIVRDAVAAMPASGEALQYSSNQGRPKLRELIAQRLNTLPGESGAGPDGSGIVMTNGSQQSLYLLSQVLCNPGDIALVEAPSYFVVFDVLAGLGIEAVSMPARADGQTDAVGTVVLLERLRREGRLDRVKLAYFISYYSNPGAHC